MIREAHPAAVCSVAGCDRPTSVRKTGECSRHYHRRYAREHARPRVVAPAPVSTPCSYQAALQRVWCRRGPARRYPCEGCGQTASAWRYRGGSAHEQHGTRSNTTRDGERRTSHVTWSPVAEDYAALCAPCSTRHTRWLRGTDQNADAVSLRPVDTVASDGLPVARAQ